MSYKLVIDLRSGKHTVTVHKRRGKSKLLPMAVHPMPAKGDKDAQDQLALFLDLHNAAQPPSKS